MKVIQENISPLEDESKKTSRLERFRRNRTWAVRRLYYCNHLLNFAFSLLEEKVFLAPCKEKTRLYLPLRSFL